MGTKEFHERRGRRLGQRMIDNLIGHRKAQHEISRLVYGCFTFVVLFMIWIINYAST